jgi:tetratricopeptide (TPR) repeat protein
MIRYTCPICHCQASLPDSMGGKTYQCTTCGVRHTASGPADAAADEPLTAIPVEAGPGLLAGKGLSLTIAAGVSAGVLLALLVAVVLAGTRGHREADGQVADPGPAERRPVQSRTTHSTTTPVVPRTPFDAGKQAFAEGRYDVALAHFDDALKALNPGAAERVQILIWRGRCHEARAEFSQALEDYGRAIQEGDQSGLAHRRCGVVRARRNQYAPAEFECSKAITEGQDPGEVRGELVKVYRDSAARALRQGDAGTAAACLHWAVIHAPDDAELRGMLGEANCKLRQWDAAVAELEKAVALGAKDRDRLLASAYMSRGAERLKHGEDARALADYRKAERLDPRVTAPYKHVFGPLLKSTEVAKPAPRKKPDNDVAEDDESEKPADEKAAQADKPKEPDAGNKRPRTTGDKAKQEREAAAKLALAQQLADRAVAASNEGKNAQPLWDKARAWMKQVIRDYPDTKAAAEARKALEKLD